MLNAIIGFSLRHRALVLVGTLALLAGGIAAFSRLPIDAVPDITNNQVQILTNAPALSALEIERFVTFPIELAVKSLPDLVEMRSLSKSGLSVVTVVFDDDVDIYFGRQLILEQLRTVEGDLPEGVETPQLGPVSTGLGEIFRYVVRDTTGQYTPMQLRTIQDWIVRREMLGAEALAEVNSLGGQLKQYQVLVDPEKLAGYNLTLREVFQAAAEASDNAGGAYIETGAEHLTVRAVGLATGVEDIGATVIRASDDGIPIRIEDVATVSTEPAIRFGSASQDGKGEVVVGIVMQLKGANARVTVEGVKERMEMIRQELPDGVVIEPFYDRETLVDRTIETVASNLIEGALFVIGVLLLMLVSIRAGLVVASVIPLSMCFAGIMMLLSGQTGNLMSLGAIDFGLVVDGSLIIVENILRLMERHYRSDGGGQLTDKQMVGLVERGSIEVRKAAQFGELIIIIVYLPIVTLQGIEGKLFRPMALTVGFALIGALILSITYVPAISSLVLRGQKKVRHSPVIEWMRKIYRPSLDWALRWRYGVMAGAAILVAVAVVGFSSLGGEFVPRLDEGDIAMHLIRLPSVSLSESQKMATEVEKEIMTFPEVKTVVSHTGRAEVSTDPMGFELADMFIMLHPQDEWTSGRTKTELVDALSHRLEKFKGMGTQFLQPIEMRTNELISGVRGDVVVKIYGEDYGLLGPVAKQISEIMRSTEGGADVTAEQVEGLPQLVIKPRRERISRYGLTVADVNHIVETAVAGSKAGTVYEGERSFDLVVRYDSEARESAAAIRDILIATPVGGRVPLSELTDISIESGPNQISRQEGSRYTTVQANVRGRDVESYVNDIRAKIDAEIDLQPGYRLEYGGQFENLEKASERLTVIVPIALLLILGLLYQTFGSLRLGLLIFFCIPMSVVGGVAALLIRGMPFSISAGVGFIALFGIAVLNGIVMVAAIRKHESTGMSRSDAVKIGADERLRPVVTTAALAGFGFLPMMLATSAGAEVQRPLATVIIGGLISATLLTLIVLPVIYERFGGEGPLDDDDSGPSGSDPDDDGSSVTARSGGLRPGGAAASVIVVLILLGAAVMATAQTELNRSDFIERVQAYSPEWQQARAEIIRVGAQGSATNLLPSTRLFAEVEEIPTGDLLGSATTTIGVGQSFDFPTVYSRRSTANMTAVAAASLDAEAVRWRVQAEAASVWTDLVAAHLQLRLADTMISNARRFRHVAEIRHQVGDIGALEVKRSDVLLGRALRDSIESSHRFAEAMTRARILMGASPEETFTMPDDPVGANAPADREQLLTAIYGRHPAIRAAEARVTEAEDRRAVHRAELLPGIGLQFGLQRVDGQAGYLSGGLELEFPVSRWFGDPHTEAADATISERQANVAVLRRQLTGQLDSLLIEEHRALALVAHYRTSLIPDAREAWRISLRLYQEGEEGYLQTLDTHRTLVELERDFLDAQTMLEGIRTAIEMLSTPLQR